MTADPQDVIGTWQWWMSTVSAEEDHSPVGPFELGIVNAEGTMYSSFPFDELPRAIEFASRLVPCLEIGGSVIIADAFRQRVASVARKEGANQWRLVDEIRDNLDVLPIDDIDRVFLELSASGALDDLWPEGDTE